MVSGVSGQTAMAQNIMQDSCKDHARNVRKNSKFNQDSSMNLTRFLRGSCKILARIMQDSCEDHA